MIKNKKLNITNNYFMTMHNINKVSSKKVKQLNDILLDEYIPEHAINSIFKVKRTKHKLDNNNKYTEAAVLCVLLPFEKNSCIENMNTILTVRSKKLKTHSGQVSFPGGKLDKSDKSLTACSIRETYEEIGIESNKIKTIGVMNKYITGSGFLVTPVIASLTEGVKYNINKNEVDKLLFFPLKYISEFKTMKKSYFYNNNNEKFFYYDFTWQEYRIWGTTAIILYDMIKILMKYLETND